MNTSLTQKKVRLSQVLNIILVSALGLVVLFGWLYYRNTDIINVVKNTIPANQPGQPKYLYTIRGNGQDNLRWPQFTYATKNRIFVSDIRRVMVFDYNGKYVQTISPKEKSPGALQSPQGLLVVNDELYVADPYAKRVAVFGMDGNFKRYFGEKALKEPAFIKFRDNKFYVFDSYKSKIKILDAQGTLIKEFGSPGSKKGEFAFPFDLDVDNKGNIWVADSNNFRIQVFDQQGKLLKMWPEGVDNPVREKRKTYPTPRGIAFDKDDFLWTANTIGNYVSAIDPVNGEVLNRLTTGEDENDTLSLPNIIYIDENSRMYVTELGYKRILVYQL